MAPDDDRGRCRHLHDGVDGGSRIDQFRMMMVHSGVAPLAEVLFDDLELWDAPPANAWRL